MAGDRLGTWAALTQGPAPRPLRRPGGQGAPPATPAPTPGSSGLEGAGLVPRTGGQHRRDRPGFPSRLAEGGRRPEFGTRPKGPAAIRSFSSRLLRPHFRPGVGSWGCGAAPADRPLQSVPLQQCLPGCPGLPEERPPPRPAGPGLAPGSAVLVITCLSSCAGPDRRGHRTGRGEQGSASGWSGWGRGVELLRSPLVCSSPAPMLASGSASAPAWVQAAVTSAWAVTPPAQATLLRGRRWQGPSGSTRRVLRCKNL